MIRRTMGGTQEGSGENSCFSIHHNQFISTMSHKNMDFKQLLLVFDIGDIQP